ncbi:2'-5'-oligoadenylate synthase 1-like isoform X3 [Eubalaena glacialis]|uniref:2'-5'-oligoadenylate synthase 1-like isoform X3 n=1 Tax=Eubalaena glacialis TaxID=27606 RepID=UPI002A59BE94|nr:2'-5'-oligoadenylate synthase 1-like isoform X3 [Eubalaena glacialis]
MKKLRKTRANQLDKFIEDRLLPDKDFRTQVNEAIHIICSFLKERCFQSAPYPVRVSKVVKGGSSGKGTTLKGLSDADLVIFVTSLTSFREQLQHRRRFIEEIRKQLEACQREEIFEVVFEVQKRQRKKPRALSFVLRSPRLLQGVKFDVLPAFDALCEHSQSQGQLTKGYRPDPKVYVQLIQECESLGREGEFSPCFTELQRAFLKERPTKLKSLIRLVKHWYQMDETWEKTAPTICPGAPDSLCLGARKHGNRIQHSSGISDCLGISPEAPASLHLLGKVLRL